MAEPTYRPLRKVEIRTVAFLQAALPGVRIIQRDPGGGAEQVHDFDLSYPDGRVEPVEITEATDRRLRQAEAARADKVPGGVLPAPGLRRTWHLFPTARTSFAALRGCIPLLARLEQAGVDRFIEGLDVAGPAADLVIRFGLAAGYARSETPAPRLVVGAPKPLGVGDIWVDQPNDPGRCVLDTVAVEANKDDNIGKLDRSGAAERHLLIWVDVANALPWQDLDRGRLPVSPPSLPPAVTTVWVATTGSHGRGVLWRVRPPSAWESILPAGRAAGEGLAGSPQNPQSGK